MARAGMSSSKAHGGFPKGFTQGMRANKGKANKRKEILDAQLRSIRLQRVAPTLSRKLRSRKG